jgi:hypothetical protein
MSQVGHHRRVRSALFVLLAACIALTPDNAAAQTKPPQGAQAPVKPAQMAAQIPAQAARAAKIEIDPNPPTVGMPTQLRVSVTPPFEGALQYDFWIDETRQTQCAANSFQCEWMPATSGKHRVGVQVRHQPIGRGGRGTQGWTASDAQIVDVQEKPPPPPPAPVITVTLESPRVVAGEPASFSVSLVNATPFEYRIEMGDGKIETRTDATFTYIYDAAGPVRVIAHFDAGASTTDSAPVLFTVEAPTPPPPPIALTLAAPRNVTVDTHLILSVATTDGRPLTEYTVDRGDGSLPETRSSESVDIVYRQPGTFTASVVPVGNPTGGAETTITVRSSSLPPWLLVALVIIGLAGALAAGRAMKQPGLPPVATFHPHAVLTPRFDPPHTRGIALEVHYLPRLDTLRYSQRRPIGPEDLR